MSTKPCWMWKHSYCEKCQTHWWLWWNIRWDLSPMMLRRSVQHPLRLHNNCVKACGETCPVLYRRCCGVLIKSKYTGFCRSQPYSRCCYMKESCMRANTCPMAQDVLWNVCSLSSSCGPISRLYCNLWLSLSLTHTRLDLDMILCNFWLPGTITSLMDLNYFYKQKNVHIQYMCTKESAHINSHECVQKEKWINGNP